MLQITLSQVEMDVLFRQDPATEADGGFQGFLVDLQRRTNRNTGELLLTDADLEKIPRYAFDYGNGGWEDELQRIFGNSLGPRLGR